MALKTDKYGNVIQNDTGQDYKFTSAGDIDYSQSGSNFRAPQPTNPTAPSNGTTPPPGIKVDSKGAWIGMPTDPYQKPTPTAGDIYGLDETEMSGYNYAKEQANTAIPSADDTYMQKLRLHQAEIDAVNRIYADKLAEASRAGLNRVGSSSARQARSGLLGSDFGSALDAETEKYNREITGSIQNEQAVAIQAILGNARTEAAAEIAEKRAAKEKGYTAYTTYLNQFETKKKEKLTNLAKSLVAQGIDIKTLSPKEIDELARTYGVSKDEILASYGSEKQSYEKTQSEIDKNKGSEAAGFTLQPGEFRFDSKGNLIASGGEKIEKPESLTPYQKFQATQSVAKDAQARTQNAREMARQAELITTSYQNIANGGDRSLNTQAIITAFNKILDPTSVVRESEYDRTAQGQSLLAQLQGKVQNITAGGAGVTPETLKEAQDIATLYLKNAQASIAAENARAKQMADYFGLNSDFVGTAGYGSPAATVETKVGTDGATYYKVPGGWSDQPPTTSFNQVGGDTKTASIKQKLASIESAGSGGYKAVSPINRNGERAYGKYQILESNIPAWGAEALGFAPTLDQFMNDPAIQEKIVDYRINLLKSQGHSDQDVAAIWFSGQPLKNNNRADITGTSVPEYVERFNNA